jgi:hypothetical protein
MRVVGKAGPGAAACFAAAFTLLAIPVGLSHAEAPAPAQPTAACPPSPAALAGNAASRPAPPAAAPSSSAHASPYRPSPEAVVACVGSREINGATFTHWAIVAENAASPTHRNPAAGPPKAVMATAMGFLISTDWVIGEAASLHVEASAAEVRRRFDRLRRQQFPKPAQFGKFLQQTGETVDDLLLRVRLSMLTARIQQRVAGHGSARARQRELARFVRRFEHKWKAQTYCETLYKVRDCGHTASSL